MKYLKRFNEELNPSTYMSAARKIKRQIGDMPRAKRLEEWAQKMEMDESMKKWKENLETFSKYGTFKFNIVNPDTNEKLTADFLLEVGFDTLMFEDNYECEKDGKDNFSSMFPFYLGLIPLDEETIQKCEEIMPSAEFGNGFYWGSFFSINFTVKSDNVNITGFDFDDYDSSQSGNVSIADRASAGRFKTLMKSILTDKDFGYPSRYTDANSLYEVLERSILAECSMSSDYGFKLEDIANYISTVSPNALYKFV